MSYGPVKARAERLRDFLAQQTPPVEARLEPVDEDSTIAVLREDGDEVLRARYDRMTGEAVLGKLASKT